MLLRWMSVLLLCAGLPAVSGEVYVIDCDNSPWERSHIVEDRSSHFDVALQCRITDLDRAVVYRIGLEGLEVDTLRLTLANSYKISLSRDGRDYREFLAVDGTYGGLSNMGVFDLDVREFLAGADCLYLRSEDFDPGDGFGGCLFRIALEGRILPERAVLALLQVGRTMSPVRVDGVLDEAAWADAAWVSGFNNYHDARPLSQQSCAAFLYDEEYLYVGFRAYDTRLDLEEPAPARRDSDLYRDECIEFFVAGEDAEPYYHFAVNAANTQYDAVGLPGGGEGDRSWDAEWLSATAKVGGDRREYELAIPWREIGLDPAGLNHLRLNITRNSVVHGELQSWLPLRGGFHQPAAFARAVLSGTPAGSYGVDVQALAGNPPQFRYHSRSGAPAADAYCRLLLRDTATGEVAAAGCFAVSAGMDALEISETALPPGEYLAEMEWLESGRPVVRNGLRLEMRAEDRAAFRAELVQPWFEYEEELVVEYRNRVPDGDVIAWSLDGASGQAEAAQGTGRLSLPLPQAQGEYVLTLQIGEHAVSLPFTRAVGRWTPVRFEIGREGFWMRDGRVFFPTMMYLVSDIARAAAEGFNIVVVGHDGFTKDNREEVIAANIAQLDEAAAHGTHAALHICNLFRHQEDYDNLRYMVSRLKNHPGLAVWYLADEPSGTATSPETLRRAAEIIREIDPLHPVMGCDNSPGLFEPLAQIFDILAPDPYPVPYNDLELVADWMERSRRIRRDYASSVAVLQAFGPPFTPRTPNPAEIRNMLFQALAAGVNGVAWWADGPAHSDGNWAVYAELIGLLEELESELTAALPETLRSGGVLFASFPGLVIAVNPADRPAAAASPFALPGERFYTTGEISGEAGNLHFGPYACAVWKK